MTGVLSRFTVPEPQGFGLSADNPFGPTRVGLLAPGNTEAMTDDELAAALSEAMQAPSGVPAIGQGDGNASICARIGRLTAEARAKQSELRTLASQVERQVRALNAAIARPRRQLGDDESPESSNRTKSQRLRAAIKEHEARIAAMKQARVRVNKLDERVRSALADLEWESFRRGCHRTASEDGG